MKENFSALEELRMYIQAFPPKQRTYKNIFQMIDLLDELSSLLKQKFNLNDIAFSLKRNIRLEHHVCPVCGNEIHVYKLQRYPKTCSVSCGCKNSQDLRRALSRMRYGVDCPQQTEEVKSKIHQTMIDLYGGYTYESEELLKKVSSTNMKRYGVPVTGSSAELHRKARDTCINRYGVDHPFKLKDVRDKCYETAVQRHGSCNNVAKIVETNMRRYGVENPAQCSAIRRRQQTRYRYDNMNFDSGWEIAFYIWLIENKAEFTYHPDVQFQYEYDSRMYYYQPDFKVNDAFIEIKGDQYFNDDFSEMICPYDESQNEKYNEKYKCMLRNNVVILKSKEMKQYLDYIDQKYGKGYLKQFKRKPKNGMI